MSKIYEALQAYEFGRILDNYHNPVRVDANILEEKLPYQLIVYDVRATIGACTVLPPGSSQLAKQRAWELINEEMFGEYRPLMLDVKRALYERDIDSAITALNKLHTAMFDF